MKKRVLLMTILGAAVVMAGCGKESAPAEEVSEAVEEVVEAVEEEAVAQAEPETAAPESGEVGVEVGTEITPDENGKLSNGFFSITMPSELAGTYVAKDYEGEINIYEKESHEAGFGGFAFGVSTAKSYEEYGGMRTKIGQLTDADGTLYHVLLEFPSEIQWDYEKEEPAAFAALYDRAREIAATVQSETGGNYVDGGGCKGEEIYGDLSKKVAELIKNATNADVLEAEDLSPVYYAITQEDEAKDPMETMGIAYSDFNLDGVDEMVIGDMETGEIYDIFGSIDGAPAHVATGYFRDYYKLYGSILTRYTSESAGVSVVSTYDLLPNSTELFQQFSLKTDETDATATKWFVSYDEENWEEMTEEDYKERLGYVETTTGDKKLSFKKLGEF
ncbi:hypothetical protein [Butyrivibrio sp. MC2021]|uniref:hypothetical protein n=1 Tax=Butyrivibrio sp. MC2021 TaxID=1408306 RepID=UPI00047BBB1F|nr:hypothetical protein [Butyrivibrio sp. MC2021]